MSRFARVATLLFLLAALFIGFGAQRGRGNLAYQGRTLESWLSDLNDNRSGRAVSWTDPVNLSLAQEKASDAIRHIGANALPILMEKIQAKDREFPQFVTVWLEKRDLNIGDRSRERWAAALAIQALGSEARPVMPQLISLTTNFTTAKEACVALTGLGQGGSAPLTAAMTNQFDWIQICALWSVGQFTGRVVIPPAVIKICLTNTSLHTRHAAAWLAGKINPPMVELIPSLTTNLSDADPMVRGQAANALGSFGSTAAPALGSLSGLTNDSYSAVRSEAIDAIKKIKTSKDKQK